MTVTENYLSIIKESSLFVFGKILKEKKIELLEEDRSEDFFDISATISLSNSNLKILVTLGTAIESAKFYAIHFLRMKVEPTEQLINSSLCELVNIIVGDAKKRMQLSDISLGLPQLVEGHNHKLYIENKGITACKCIYQVEGFQFKQIVQITMSENEAV